MKKHYLFILPLLFSLVSNGQPILTNANTSFIIGEVYNQKSVDYMPEGNSGAMVTWDFSMLNIDTSTVFTAYSPSESPDAASFPDATIFLADGGNNVQEFYKASTTSLERLGYAVDTIFLISLSDPETFLTYPFTYNSSFNDDFYGEYEISGFAAVRSGSCSATGDAYGTITLPSGTYTNALRIKYTEDYTDDIFGFVTTYTNTQYLWYIPGNHYPVFTSYTFITSTDFSDNTRTGSSYFIPGVIGLNQYENSKNLSVFPNPTQNAANISYELKDNTSVKINLVNGVGQIVDELNFPLQPAGKYNVPFDVRKQNKGIYMVQLIVDGKITTKPLVVE